MNKEQPSLQELGAIRAQAGRIAKAFQRSRSLAIVIALLLVLVVGLADYFSGYQISLSIFYLLAISFALWNVGVPFAIFVSLLSIVSWLVGDWAAGVVYPNRFVPIWNALITFSFYMVVIWLLSRLKSFQQTLEARIRERTAALRSESEARERLEKEVTEVTERERRRIGHDLHDTVCQHLTGTSLALQVLGGKLEKDSLPQKEDADKAVELVEQAIELTRNVAKGLFPLELEGQGLGGALLELSRSTEDRYRVICEFKCDSDVPRLNSTTATHLYRIAQEAVANAIKHGHVSRILIELSLVDANLILTVRDDGIGLPRHLPNDRGIGLRIMASRAGMIDGSLSVENGSGGGTIVTCRRPVPTDELNSLKNLEQASF